MGYLVISSVVGGMLAASAEDSDDPFDYALALWANRLNSELAQYMNPSEFMRILGSPEGEEDIETFEGEIYDSNEEDNLDLIATR